MINIHLICAARPNFMKIAPLYHELKNENWCKLKIVHTGQHYDCTMSQAFFDDLMLPEANYHLGVGSGTHAEQTAKTMLAYEKLCLEEDKPDLIIVVGDVTATLSCTLVGKKCGIRVAHLEAGLRSGDRSMPEELNRLVTDAICDYHWIPSHDAEENLLREGVDPKKISFVGNIMIDSYHLLQGKINQLEAHVQFELEPKQYAVLTLHRPNNVDQEAILSSILDKISQIDFPVVFPIHPRTQKTILQLNGLPKNIITTDPLGYIDFMSLVTNSAYVISDSGGIQEETTYLGIPCYTLRDSTERPVTLTQGTNQLVNVDNLLEKLSVKPQGSIPERWDGKTASRIKTFLEMELL